MAKKDKKGEAVAQEPKSMSAEEKKEFKELQKLAYKACSSLQSKETVVGGRRIRFFSGKKFCQHLEEKYDKSHSEAHRIGSQLLRDGVIVRLAIDEKVIKRSGKADKVQKSLTLERKTPFIFSDDMTPYYWRIEPTNYKSLFIGGAMLVAVLAVVLMPLWPESVRRTVSNVGWGLLPLALLLLVMPIIRWVLQKVVYFLTCKKYNFVLLPNLEDESLGVLDSFKPVYEFDVVRDDFAEDSDSDEEEMGDGEASGQEDEEAASDSDDNE
eukprot:m.9808 g.9808  ORF g.9808 m.9808 type:complete len:268 (-) comp5495_c0_seq1:171-974(-)